MASQEVEQLRQYIRQNGPINFTSNNLFYSISVDAAGKFRRKITKNANLIPIIPGVWTKDKWVEDNINLIRDSTRIPPPQPPSTTPRQPPQSPSPNPPPPTRPALPISGGAPDEVSLTVQINIPETEIKIKINGADETLPADGAYQNDYSKGVTLRFELHPDFKRVRHENKTYKFKKWELYAGYRKYTETEQTSFSLRMGTDFDIYILYEETTGEAEFIGPLGSRVTFKPGRLEAKAAERMGEKNLPRVTMAINKGKYELNSIASAYVRDLLNEYKNDLEQAKKKLKAARDAYYKEWRKLTGLTAKKGRFFRYTIRKGFSLPFGMGDSQKTLEDILEKEKATTERNRIRDLYEEFLNAESEVTKFKTEKLDKLEKTIKERLTPAAKAIASKQIYRYKIGDNFSDAKDYISKTLEEYAAELAAFYARKGKAPLLGAIGVMNRLAMKSNTLRGIWYQMLYNIWDFIWGPMFLGLIMAFIVMAGFISFYIIPTYALNASLFLYIIPLAGAAINWVMNFQSGKYALDYLDSMVSGALIAQGITIFLFALIGQPGLYLDTFYYYMLFAFLFIFFGIFQFYQTGGFPIVLKMSVLVLIFGWVALGPYKAVYEGAINQVRTPVLVAWRAGTNAVSDISLLVTNPTAWYAKQQTTNVRPERSMAIPRALEVTSINLLPQAVPQGAEFAMFLIVKNDGDLPARNIKIADENDIENVKCNSYCEFTDGKTAKITSLDKRNGEAYLMPGEAGRIEIRGLRAKYEENRRAESRLGIVYINLSYDYSTNSSLLVSVMSKNEFARRFAEREDVFRQIVAVGKVSPAQLSLNVGPQPLESGKRALLLVSVSNARDDGRIFLRQFKDAIIIRMQKVIGSGLECGAGGIPLDKPKDLFIGTRKIHVDFDSSREEALVYLMQNNQEIRQYEFSSIFSILCSFQSVPDSNLATAGVQTGLITAELPTYEFRIIKEQTIPITGFIGIVANPSDTACNQCGTQIGILNSCTRNTCYTTPKPPSGQCWLDTSQRPPGSSVVADTGICRACAEKSCGTFTQKYDCETEALQRCSLSCLWEPSTATTSVGVGIASTDVPDPTRNGRCKLLDSTAPRPPTPTEFGGSDYCTNKPTSKGGKQCIIGEGNCKSTFECESSPGLQTDPTGQPHQVTVECRNPGIGINLCCFKSNDGYNWNPHCIQEYDKIKQQSTPTTTTTGEIAQKIIQMARTMKPTGADEQIRSDTNGQVNSFESLVLKLAKVESEYRQCEDGTLSCVNDNSYSTVWCSKCKAVEGSCTAIGERLSCGIMQINIKVHNPQNFFGCASFANVDCNIRSGIRILLDSYSTYKGGSQNNCGYTYIGWKAALRGYNGWACGTNADTKFVEKVLNKPI